VATELKTKSEKTNDNRSKEKKVMTVEEKEIYDIKKLFRKVQKNYAEVRSNEFKSSNGTLENNDDNNQYIFDRPESFRVASQKSIRRRKKFREKKKQKRREKIRKAQELRNANQNNFPTAEKIKFGEVAERPPQFSVLPKKKKKMNNFSNNPSNDLDYVDIEEMYSQQKKQQITLIRQQAIQAYKKVKSKRMQAFNVNMNA